MSFYGFSNETQKKFSGTHALFSPSSPYWLRYSDDEIFESIKNKKAAEMGTRLHAWAKETIDLGIKQPKSKNTLYNYVNDAIGYKMDTEVVLYYSDYFYGTTDAICFRDNFLRIHDLKTGKTSVHMEQLYIYAAIFCLQYNIDPNKIEIELRIYQNNDILVDNPEKEKIIEIMNRITYLDKLISKKEVKY